MEVRGGCGYIEEWSDPRLVRDAHLGSIWEGTSNIVALDVIRAIKREGSLPVLQPICTLLARPMLPACARTAQALERAAAAPHPGRGRRGRRRVLARQAATASTTAPRPSPWPGKPRSRIKRAPAPVATGAAAPCAAARSAGRRRLPAPAG
jgi:hypothetical protein